MKDTILEQEVSDQKKHSDLSKLIFLVSPNYMQSQEPVFGPFSFPKLQYFMNVLFIEKVA